MSAEPESLVFAGRWRDAIPRALVFDPILDAVAVRVYLFLFTRSQPDHCQTAFPSYQELGQHLRLSRPTVVRAMHLLRAARWITRVGEIRGTDGRFLTNTYLLHDEPLALAEALRLDGHYMAYLEGLEQHRHPGVQRAAKAILNALYKRFERWGSIDDAPTVEERLQCQGRGHVPGRSDLDLVDLDEFAVNADEDAQADQATDRVHVFNPVVRRVKKVNSAKIRVKNLNPAQDDRVKKINSVEISKENQTVAPSVQKFDSVSAARSSSCSSYIKTTATDSNLPRARAKPDVSHLVFPGQFSHDERHFAALQVKDFDTPVQQALLDELAGQIDEKAHSSRPIRNPIKYLAWLCQQMRKGHDPVTSAGLKLRNLRATGLNTKEPGRHRMNGSPVPPERIQQHLQAMRAQLHGAPHRRQT
jgi:hypothetical protein